MRDLKYDIAARLSAAGHPVDDGVVEELAQHASAAFASARAEGLGHDEADAHVRGLIDAWVAEGAHLRHRRRESVVEPPSNGSAFVAGIAQDVRYACRLAWRRPGPATVAALTIALGIGATTTLFSVAWGVMMKPLPWPEPETLIRLQETREGATRTFPWILTNGTLLAWQDSPATIEAVAAYSPSTVTLTGDGGSERITTASATASLFTVLRAVPVRGRLFTAADEAADNVTVLSYEFWTRRLGAADDVIGRTLQFDGRGYEVVGVLPPGFDFPARETAAWTPYKVQPTHTPDGGSSMQLFSAIARLKPGATAAQAAQEATARAAALPDPGMVAIAVFGSKGAARVTAEPILDAVTADVREALWVLLAAVGLLLVTATANVASVQLARAAARGREMAVRAAIGAGGGRLARQLIVESLVVGLAGGVAGLAISVALHRALPSLLPADFPRVADINIDAGVLAFSFAIALAASLAFGLAPALHVRRLDLRTGLTDDAAATGAGFGRTKTARVRALIMAGQVAVACILLIGASLMVRTFITMLNVDRGYEASNVLTARIATPGGLFTPERRAALASRTLERLRSRPEVVHAGLTNALPLMGGEAMMALSLPPVAGQPAQTINSGFRVISPGYIEAMGIDVIEGRLFDERDTATATPALVVNRAFAQRYLPDHAAGMLLPVEIYKTQGWQVIGVIENVRMRGSLTEPAQPELFVSYTQAPRGPASDPVIVVRMRGASTAMVETLRQIVTAEEPSAVLESVMTMDERVMGSLARPRLYAVVLAGFAACALLIAAVGLFGVLSYSVAQRSRELGVRAALGARPGQIVGLVLREGLIIGGVGIAAGVGAALLVTEWMSSFLYGVAPRDAVTFVGVPVGLLLITALACALPARRAARLDPLKVLRAS
jgi:predicted permease